MADQHPCRHTRRTAFPISLAVAVLILSACGSASSRAVSSTAHPSTRTVSTAVTRVSTASTSLGIVLVTSSGMTLYADLKDTGSVRSCTASCQTLWPPLIAEGTVTAEGSANASLLGTLTLPDGKLQVTYAGHPLYTFVHDTAPGDVNGEGVLGIWFVLGPDGSPVKAASISSPSPASSSTSHGGW